MSKIFDDGVISQNFDVIAIFPIHDQLLFLYHRKKGCGIDGFNGPRHLLFLKEYLKVYSYTAFKISQCGRVQVNVIL